MSGNGELKDLFDAKTLDGEGKTEMVIFEHDGMIIQRFRTPQEWIGYEPSNAVSVAKHMIDMAVEAGAKVTIQLPKYQVTPQQRLGMIKRAEHIIRSMSADGRKLDYIAQQVVDSILISME